MSLIEQLRREDSFPVAVMLRHRAADEIDRLNRVIREMEQCGLSRAAAEVLHPPAK